MDTKLAIQTNPVYKDRLFKFIFGQDTEQSKKWRLQLYNALNGTNYSDPDALRINTIENVIYITMHNDISFLIDTEMNLYEQQSTYNPNMPLRGFFYFAILYQIFLSDNHKNVLSSQLVKIPTPKFYVFYNGTEKQPDSWKMKLSDAFMGDIKSSDFEWTATIINLHPNHNSALNKSCTPLYHYVKFITFISENRKSGMNKQLSIEKAVNQAIKEKLLEGFFVTYKAEVIGMCLTEFDEEECKRIWHEDGFIDGKNEGRKETAIENARNFLKMKVLTPEQIAQGVGLPVEEVLEISKEI